MKKLPQLIQFEHYSFYKMTFDAEHQWWTYCCRNTGIRVGISYDGRVRWAHKEAGSTENLDILKNRMDSQLFFSKDQFYDQPITPLDVQIKTEDADFDDSVLDMQKRAERNAHDREHGIIRDEHDQPVKMPWEEDDEDDVYVYDSFGRGRVKKDASDHKPESKIPDPGWQGIFAQMVCPECENFVSLQNWNSLMEGSGAKKKICSCRRARLCDYELQREYV